MNERWGQPVSAWPLRLIPNGWDGLAFILVLGTVFGLAWGSKAMTEPFPASGTTLVSLDPRHLPEYALRSVLRMAAALFVSLAFSFPYAALAARSRQAEKLLVPLLDILQSVPVLGYLSITVTGFMALFPGSMLGMECAAIFAIFTSQAWNITFSLYQSFSTVPRDLVEAAAMMRLSPWQRFLRLDVPFAMPSMVWNMMMSISGGWFFVVASEAISVSGQTILLPGIGSYIALAISHRSPSAVVFAVATMFLVIILYDQLVFRPLLAWCDKFRFDEPGEEEPPQAWVLTMLRRARVVRAGLEVAHDSALAVLDRVGPSHRSAPSVHRKRSPRVTRTLTTVWNVLLLSGTAVSLAVLARFVSSEATWGEVGRVFFLGLATAIRVFVMIILASLIWVPIGVWIGLHPLIAQRAQPIVQFCAAFPANLLYPVAVVLIVNLHLNAEIWVSPLMILGTQWYILFNVIAGTAAIPRDVHYVARNLGVRGWVWWTRVALPAIFPGYLVGAVTAAGGCWNASIVAEVIEWGSTRISVAGLGAYIAHWTTVGDFPRIALGIGVLCLYVVLFNRVLWRPLHAIAEERSRLN